MKRGLNVFGVLLVGLFAVLTFLGFLNPLVELMNSLFLASNDNFLSFQLIIFPAIALFALVFAFIIAIRGGGGSA